MQTPFVWADKRPDMRDRLSLNNLPIVGFLASHVAVAPGQPFRGYVDELYTGGAVTTTMVDEILKHWHENMGLYGSGFHTFNWQAFSIPTMSQYNAFITPEYFWLYSRLYDTAAQQQSVNMMAITRPNLKMLAAMGMRYLVVNDVHPELDEKSREVYSWKNLRVRDLSDPNLMSYSPVAISVVASWADALKAMAQPSFDPQRQVILDREPSLAGAILSAKTRDARFERGGFHIAVEAQGPSIILLPVQYSHCYSIVHGRGQLVRANVVMTALLVDGSAEIDAEFKFGPFGHTSCRRLDLEEIEAHLPQPGIRTMIRKASLGRIHEECFGSVRGNAGLGNVIAGFCLGLAAMAFWLDFSDARRLKMDTEPPVWVIDAVPPALSRLRFTTPDFTRR